LKIPYNILAAQGQQFVVQELKIENAIIEFNFTFHWATEHRFDNLFRRLRICMKRARAKGSREERQIEAGTLCARETLSFSPERLKIFMHHERRSCPFLA
jgi:hypothetical protein